MQKEETLLHKEDQKIKKAQSKQLPKKERSFAEKHQKQAATEHLKQLEQRHEQRQLRWNIELREHAKYGEHEVKWASRWEQHEELKSYLNEKDTINFAFMESEYVQRVTHENEHYDATCKQLDLLHPLELENLKRQQELERTHMDNQQKTEKQQQDELLTYDHRTELRDFNKTKASEDKQLKQRIKQYKKENAKKLTKEELKSYEATSIYTWELAQAVKFDEFLKKQRAQRDEEESLLRVHHENQMERLCLNLDEILAEKLRVQQETRDTFKNEHERLLARLEREFWLNKLAMLRSSHKEMYDAELMHTNSELPLLDDQMVDVVTTHEAFKEDFRTLALAQGIPQDTQLVDILSSLVEYSAVALLDAQRKSEVLRLLQEEELFELQLKNAREEEDLIYQAPNAILDHEKKLANAASVRNAEEDGGTRPFPEESVSSAVSRRRNAAGTKVINKV
eukprot:TRINITY_DN8924_c0_g1_i2.p1 TRINITY_DN8924_c0_g1~~TRINITY_DN8924_c0_g1_i2.p1  ORF type:complete len:453 (+),score=124.37 TRINITY_DN8924_c0_g1_i2:46-1404(+)